MAICECPVGPPVGPTLAATCGGSSFMLFMGLLEVFLRSQCDLEDPCGRPKVTFIIFIFDLFILFFFFIEHIMNLSVNLIGFEKNTTCFGAHLICEIWNRTFLITFLKKKPPENMSA